MLTSRQISFLKYCCKGEFIINADNSVDVNGDVDLPIGFMKKIPVQFNAISGNFDCSSNSLTTLKGSPRTCNTFTCDGNKLKNLLEGPLYTNSYQCSDNPLTSLIGAPVKTEEFLCYRNKLAVILGIGCYTTYNIEIPKTLLNDFILKKASNGIIFNSEEEFLTYIRKNSEYDIIVNTIYEKYYTDYEISFGHLIK